MADPAVAGASPGPDDGDGAGGEGKTRKEKRKALKKLKRKQARKEAAIREWHEQEARANDPEEQLRIQLREQEEAEIAERERKAFEERELLWLEDAAARKAAEEEAAAARRKNLLEESQQDKSADNVDKLEEGEEWEYIEEGPAEIIWQGNEIIVKKKRVRVVKRSYDRPPIGEDEDRPTSNPLPPQSVAYSSYLEGSSVPAHEVLERVAQETPNFGTEQDKAHCPFHLKTGACRFGSRCSRVHFYPDRSCTLLIKNMYNGPGLAWEQDEGLEYTDEEIERCYEEFYEDVHTEFLKFGELINFKVCRNGSYHLRGNVYVHYKSLDSAILAYNNINGRYFAGKQITCEFVGVTRWKAAICGEYMKSRFKTCSHGTACNFIHCFRNPGGDYEWADWDNPPPKYWIKKMTVLFGPSSESEYAKPIESVDCRRSRSSDRRRTPMNDRYASRRSNGLVDGRTCMSMKDDQDLKDPRSHMIRREHSRSRRESSKYSSTELTEGRYRDVSHKHEKYEERHRFSDQEDKRECREKEEHYKQKRVCELSKSRKRYKHHVPDEELEPSDSPSHKSNSRFTIDEERYRGRCSEEPHLDSETDSRKVYEPNQTDCLIGRRERACSRSRQYADYDYYNYEKEGCDGKFGKQRISNSRDYSEDSLDGQETANCNVDSEGDQCHLSGTRSNKSSRNVDKSQWERNHPKEKHRYNDSEEHSTSDCDSLELSSGPYRKRSKICDKNRSEDKSRASSRRRRSYHS